MKKYRILFVCLGNICRSPLAEGIMQSYLERESMESQIEVDSAGILSIHRGELPDPRMRAHASRRGYNLVSRSRPVVTDDFDKFDLILGMDDRNIDDLKDLAPSIEAQQKIRRMADFCRNIPADHVPDPFFGGASGFERVLDILEDACEGLLEHLKKKLKD
ncbi:low molecular weight protein-tyrosine-phosphatase [Bacteroides sedimenti]|uniref:Phosphotyrosine protein phosphatase n=1 Tax=Bacteroides sedimenti TaxID=2136147 RepID=A0ABN6Z5G8_9BACE